jgi:hypothetical protein
MTTVSPLKPEGVQDWLGKKLDWNPTFIPSSQRPAPPPPQTLASDHSAFDDNRRHAQLAPRITRAVHSSEKRALIVIWYCTLA